MTQATEIKVKFTRQNAKKCVCWQCPVQTDSACIKANGDKMGDVMTTPFFTPDIVPGLYCSSGVAACKDIATDRSCICGACPIYQDFRLGGGQPLDHYCKNGRAG